mgnify:CR=1 FL=1
MKCKICKGKPVIYLRASNLALCEEHFIERFEKITYENINKFKMFKENEKILVAVSGGKDSLSLLYLLKKSNFNVYGLHINLGIEENDYSLKSEEYVKKFSRNFDVKIYIYDLKKEKGKGITELVKEKKNYKACSICGIVKRYIMNKFASDEKFDVIATGHNLDDEVSRLFGNIIFWQEGYLIHQDIVLEKENGLLKKVKPFAFFAEKETCLYAILNKIDYIKDECPYSLDAKTIFYKNILNKIEENSPGAKIRFYKGFFDVQKKYFRRVHKKYIDLLGEEKKCKICGMPTIKEICGFCRIFEK